MSKKIMIINGSPRKGGNTTIVANWVAAGAMEAGAEVELIDATRLENKANGCQGCRSCNNNEKYRCVIKDETSELVTRILEQDVVVFATPVYFGSCSAQLKRLLDRMYCFKRILGGGRFTVEPGLKNVSLALIATAGADEKSGLTSLAENMRDVTAGLNKELQELLLPFCPAQPTEMASREAVRDQAKAFGKQLTL